MGKSKSINGNKKVIKALNDLMKDLDKKVSIRVGIIGDKAYELHKTKDANGEIVEGNLTNAEVGAIHEFGATINVTKKMRNFFYAKWGIHKSNKPIVIPARSFLRDTFFNKENRQRLLDVGYLKTNKDYMPELDGTKVNAREANKDKFEYYMKQDPGFFMSVCNVIGAKALEMVHDSFVRGGYPNKWRPISEITKKNRIKDPSSPPLTDSAELFWSISCEVKELK